MPFIKNGGLFKPSNGEKVLKCLELTVLVTKFAYRESIAARESKTSLNDDMLRWSRRRN